MDCSVRRNRSPRCADPLPEANMGFAAAHPVMKILLSLMLLCGSGSAMAQTIHRCVDPQGNISVQDRACMKPAEARSTLPQYAPMTPEQQRHRASQHRDIQEALTENIRVLKLLRDSGNAEATQYGENRRRCESARHIAALCGKSVAGYSCDDKGFRLRYRLSSDPQLDSLDRRSAEQCVLRATMGSP